MSMPEKILITARCDADDHLIAADEPLAGLQLRCGGVIPGPLAVPELRALVDKARGFGLKLARPIMAQDGQDQLRAWIEVTPDDHGCQILLRNWQATPLPPEASDLAGRRRAEIDRALSELTARLDARQRIIAVEADAADLQGLARAMRGGIGRLWTEFVKLDMQAYQQPLHWRLLDGAQVAIEGSARVWRAALIAQEGAEGEVLGFDLCLTSDEPLPRAAALPEPVQGQVRSSVIGRELAPVLRQPISAIIAHAEMIRGRMAGPLADDYAGYAGDIADAGQHLLGLIEDLADIEAIETPDFTPAADHIDLADVARKAAGILGGRAREKSIVIEAPSPEAHVPVVAEFRRVLQVLLNLIGNAIRYSPEKSTIAIRLEQVGPRALVVVADQGPGLSPEDALRVFDKFERLGRSGDGGTGLGLYISRRLARAMKGDLTVASEPGNGAAFALELPAEG